MCVISMNIVTEIKLFDADSFDYSGSIVVYNDSSWDMIDITNEMLLEAPRLMPLKGILQMLISYNLVYEIIPCGEQNKDQVIE
jgi:hypothetical protein